MKKRKAVSEALNSVFTHSPSGQAPLTISVQQAEELIDALISAIDLADKRWEEVGDGSFVMHFSTTEDDPHSGSIPLAGVSFIGDYSCIAIPAERIEYPTDADIVLVKG